MSDKHGKDERDLNLIKKDYTEAKNGVFEKFSRHKIFKNFKEANTGISQSFRNIKIIYLGRV